MFDFYKDKIFIKKLLGLAVPIALESLLLALVGASDTIMLGKLNQNAMSAVSLATQVQFIQNVTVTGVVAAFSILGAQYCGKKDHKTVNELLCMSLNICVIISVIFAGLCIFIPEKMMLIYTNEKVLIDLGVKYLKIAGWSYLMVGFSQCFLALMKLSDHASELAKISTVAVVINIVLNAILIFGLLGAPAFGVRGAAIATAIARVIELAWSAIFILRDRSFKVDFSYLFTFNKVLWGDFVKQLIPLMGASVIWTVGISSYSAFMGHMGVDAAASNSVVSVVRSLVSSFSRGIACGAAIMIGNELGAGNLKRAEKYGDWMIALSLICGAVSAIMIVAMIPPSLSLVSLSADATKHFYSMMYILAVYMIGCSLNSVINNGIFAAGGDTKFDFYSLAVVMWCIAVPLAAAGTFVFKWPVAVVYACTCLDEVGKIPWVIHHYKKKRWVKNLTR